MSKINIAADFSKLPGPRYRGEGSNSGEDFRERILRPRFDAARASGERLVIELDGVKFGYPTSFLEEAFGGLARIVGIEPVLAVLTFVSKDEPLLPAEIERYVRFAEKTSRERVEAARQ